MTNRSAKEKHAAATSGKVVGIQASRIVSWGDIEAAFAEDETQRSSGMPKRTVHDFATKKFNSDA